jgi:hypothetical protein
MTKSPKPGILEAKSNGESRHSRNSRPLAVRRPAKIRCVGLCLCYFVISFIDCGTEIEKVNVVAKQFMTALQNYTQVEKEYRHKQRARVERQFKIGQS